MSNTEDSKRYSCESGMVYLTRIIRWLCIIIGVLIITMAGMATGFFLYESQYEEYTETVSQESLEGGNNYIGADGFIINK